MIDLLEKYDWKPYNHIVPCPISRKPSSPMVLLPRLSSRVRVALYGDKEGIADAERLEAERVEDFPEDDGEEFTWKAWSRRLSGSSKARGKPAKRAFDEFIAAVATHVSRDAAASLSANASGEVYDALRADNSSKKTRARAQVEAAFGIVKDWRSVVDAFESLNTFDNTKNETAAPKQEAEMMLEWADPDYVTVESKTQAPPTKEDGESSPEWLIAKCDSLKNQALSTLDVALGVVAAAKTDDPNAFQGQLFELLGFSDEAISVMGELCERQEYIARINPSSVRKALATSPPPSQGDTQQRTRQAGSVTINSASASKQSKKKRQKEQAKQQKNRTPVSEASDMLASLGFDPAYLEQERSLGLQKNVKPSSSHAHQLLDGQQREFFDVRGPAGERFFGDGYEEVVIDPPKRLDPPGPGELVDLDAAMPTWARKCFPSSTKSLNRIQSAVFEGVFHSQKNILVCAPTGAGKTYVALLSVLEVIKRHVESVLLDAAAAGKSSGGGARDKEEVAQLLSSHKIVYIAPLKALAQEVVQKFSERLQPLGLKVRELTGDVQLSRREADQAHVLVATPEKWDVVTRKQGTEGSLAARCRLLIIDEIHLLAEERGAVLECIVARTRRLVESSQLGVRLLGLSATLPNYADVAEFLACPDDGVFFFGPEFRPVPLKQTFIGVTEPKRLKAAAKLDEIAYETALDAIDRGTHSSR